MKHLKVLLWCGVALLFGVSGSAWATIVFHHGGSPADGPVPISGANLPVNFSWGTCPEGYPDNYGGNNQCMQIQNQTNGPISMLTFSFSVNAEMAGQALSCVNDGGEDYLTQNNCPEVIGAEGTTLTISFWGGNPIPAASTPPVPAVAFLNPMGCMFDCQGGIGTFSISGGTLTNGSVTAVPEPGVLGMFGLGLVLLGLGIGARRRWN